jgi:hypothetical protein
VGWLQMRTVQEHKPTEVANQLRPN